MIIKESKARSNIYIGSELYNHLFNLSPFTLLHYLVLYYNKAKVKQLIS
jgi:hypothetical protein